MSPGKDDVGRAGHRPSWAARMTRSSDWGEWTFRNRSWLPVPLAAGVVVLGHHLHPLHRVVAGGLALETLGETIRLWAVRHIGVISRTRAGRVGPLITSGPYGLVRNPLYVGNWCLWTGVVICSGALWMLPLVWTLFAVQYALMTSYEERLLQTRHPDYADYMRRVPAWIPRGWLRTSVNLPPVPRIPWGSGPRERAKHAARPRRDGRAAPVALVPEPAAAF